MGKNDFSKKVFKEIEKYTNNGYLVVANKTISVLVELMEYFTSIDIIGINYFIIELDESAENGNICIKISFDAFFKNEELHTFVLEENEGKIMFLDMDNIPLKLKSITKQM